MILTNVISTTIEKAEVIDFYKEMLNNQSTNFWALIIFFLTITTALIGATWIWNFYYAKKQIKSEVDEQIREAEEKLNTKYDKLLEDKLEGIESSLKEKYDELLREEIVKIDSKYDLKIAKINADTSRLFYNVSFKENHYKVSLIWLSLALESYIKLALDEPIRDTIERMLFVLNISGIKEDNNDGGMFNPDKIISVVNKAPQILKKEKDEIIKILNSLRTDTNKPIIK